MLRKLPSQLIEKVSPNALRAVHSSHFEALVNLMKGKESASAEPKFVNSNNDIKGSNVIDMYQHGLRSKNTNMGPNPMGPNPFNIR